MLSTLLADTVVVRPEPWHWFWVIPLLWIGLIALLAFRFRRGCGPRGRWGWREGGGRSVLDERFARGEITADEYRERRAVIEEDRR